MNLKVLFAYCQELGRIVSISDARTEFFSRKPEERKRFTFSCSDQSCGVTITGVNYHIKAEEGIKFKASHFASRKPHQPKCEWLKFTEEIEQTRRSNESEHDFTERQLRRKLSDYINCFDPSIDDESSIVVTKNEISISEKSIITNTKERKEAEGLRWNQYTTTNQLQRLIDTWQEAKNKLAKDKNFLKLRIKVVGLGTIYLYEYITHIKNTITNKYNGVVYGGATLIKRWGKGFSFKFFDKYNDMPIKLYVDNKIMERGRFSHYIDEVLKTPNVRYFKIFLLNPEISENPKFKELNLKMSSLRQLAIYFELKTKKSDESGSDTK